MLQQILWRILWYAPKQGKAALFSSYERKTKIKSKFFTLKFSIKNSCTLQIGKKMSKPGLKSQRQAWRFIWYQKFCSSSITRALMSFSKMQKIAIFWQKSTFFDLNFLHLVKTDLRRRFQTKLKFGDFIVFSVKLRSFWWVQKLINLIF